MKIVKLHSLASIDDWRSIFESQNMSLLGVSLFTYLSTWDALILKLYFIISYFIYLYVLMLVKVGKTYLNKKCVTFLC